MSDNTAVVRGLRQAGMLVSLTCRGWTGECKLNESELLQGNERDVASIVATLLPPDDKKAVQRAFNRAYQAKQYWCVELGPVGWMCPTANVDRFQQAVEEAREELRAVVEAIVLTWPEKRRAVLLELFSLEVKLQAQGMAERMSQRIPEDLTGRYEIELIFVPLPTWNGDLEGGDLQERYEESVRTAAEQLVAVTRTQLRDAIEQLMGRLRSGSSVTMRTVNSQRRFVARTRAQSAFLRDSELEAVLDAYEGVLDERATEADVRDAIATIGGVGVQANELAQDGQAPAAVIGRLGRSL